MPSGSESFRLLTAQGYRHADQFRIASQFWTGRGIRRMQIQKNQAGSVQAPSLPGFFVFAQGSF